MGWDDLIDALDELETEVEYDGYFCSIKDAVIIVHGTQFLQSLPKK